MSHSIVKIEQKGIFSPTLKRELPLSPKGATCL
jgi:hypothetical protein